MSIVALAVVFAACDFQYEFRRHSPPPRNIRVYLSPLPLRIPPNSPYGGRMHCSLFLSMPFVFQSSFPSTMSFAGIAKRRLPSTLGRTFPSIFCHDDRNCPAYRMTPFWSSRGTAVLVLSSILAAEEEVAAFSSHDQKGRTVTNS